MPHSYKADVVIQESVVLLLFLFNCFILCYGSTWLLHIRDWDYFGILTRLICQASDAKGLLVCLSEMLRGSEITAAFDVLQKQSVGCYVNVHEQVWIIPKRATCPGQLAYHARMWAGS